MIVVTGAPLSSEAIVRVNVAAAVLGGMLAAPVSRPETPSERVARAWEWAGLLVAVAREWDCGVGPDLPENVP